MLRPYYPESNNEKKLYDNVQALLRRFDILNFGNFLNKRWGRIDEISFPSNRSFVNFNGLDDIGLTLRHADKIRTYEARGETFEVVQLWIEVTDGQRRDRFNVDVHDGKAATAAKALPKDALVEITGKLRHDRWQDQATKAWRGKIYIAVEPGEGSVERREEPGHHPLLDRVDLKLAHSLKLVLPNNIAPVSRNRSIIKASSFAE